MCNIYIITGDPSVYLISNVVPCMVLILLVQNVFMWLFDAKRFFIFEKKRDAIKKGVHSKRQFSKYVNEKDTHNMTLVNLESTKYNQQSFNKI